MFTKILIATDLSAASHAVVQCAAGLRSLGAKECLLLQCLNVRQLDAPGVAQAAGVIDQTLQDQKILLEKAGMSVQTEVVPGFAQVEINRIARERNCSLVVVGSHGHSLLGEMLLGGVASAVIHHAVKPVLVVRVKRTPGGEVSCALGATCDFLRHVYFPTDFSPNADHAFQTVKHLVADGVRAVTLSHVQDQARIDPHLMHRIQEFDRIDRERLDKMKDALAKAGTAKIDIEIGLGRPAQKILQDIEGKQATLVVMGSQGRGFVSESFLGSVSHQVARRSPAPVLLIPAKR
jgi:nucleotide-binding universal stress UspA family protein